jgi:two-component system LytT family response regulator
MSYRAFIIDDEPLARRIVRAFLREEPSIEIVGEAANGPEAIVQILGQRPDLLFLDVQLPELDGFAVLREIWAHYQPLVVFATAFDTYAIRAFEVSAADYLLKPFDQFRFQQAVERAKQQLALRSSQDTTQALRRLLAEVAPAREYVQRLLVKDQHKLFFVKVADILYFEADRNYITLHTATHPYLLYTSLSQLEQQLDPQEFTRINRSCLVNLDHIEELQTYFNGEYWVKLRTGQILKWTRNYRHNLEAYCRRA